MCAHFGTLTQPCPALVGVHSLGGICTCSSRWGLQHSPPLCSKDLSGRSGDIMRVETSPTNIPKNSKSVSETEPYLLGLCAPKPQHVLLALDPLVRFPSCHPHCSCFSEQQLSRLRTALSHGCNQEGNFTCSSDMAGAVCGVPATSPW